MVKRMFSFITDTCSPIAMRCGFKCDYCWSEALKDGRLKNTSKYKDLVRPYLVEKEYARHFKKGDFVFIEDMGDLFWDGVSDELVRAVLQMCCWISVTEGARVLILTKNPARMLQFADMLPKTALVGATIETNRAVACSKAPHPFERVRAMIKLEHPHKFVCIEPIMDFDLAEFMTMIARIKPEKVAVGYDNHKNNLPEPPLWKTMELINSIEFLDIPIEKKSLREARARSYLRLGYVSSYLEIMEDETITERMEREELARETGHYEQRPA